MKFQVQSIIDWLKFPFSVAQSLLLNKKVCMVRNFKQAVDFQSFSKLTTLSKDTELTSSMTQDHTQI